MRSRGRIAALAVALAVLATPAAAHAAVWKEGTAGHPFGISNLGGLIMVSSSGGDPDITVPYEASTAFEGAPIEFEPRSVRVAKDGSYLVACGKHGYVLKLSKNGTVLKRWVDAGVSGLQNPSDVDLPGIQRPFDAYPLDDGGMIVVDRVNGGDGYVARIDASNHVVWKYGGSGGFDPGGPFDPFTAEPVGANHMLISDSLGFRVIEVDNATGAVVWSYGQYLKEGPGPGLLIRPHSAQRLANGNTLICDSEDYRVIEVTPSGNIAWSYGQSKVRGSGSNQLFSPNSARRLSNGSTLICDSDNNRVIEVNRQGSIVQAYGVDGRTPSGGPLLNPRAAVRLADGSTTIADLGHFRLARYRYHPNRSYSTISGRIDPAVGKIKWFSRVSVGAAAPPGGLVTVQYRTGVGAWLDVGDGAAIPGSAKGSAIQYRLTLATGDSADAAPVVRDVSITWSDTAPVVGGGESGTHAGSSGSGSSSNSGTGTRSTIAHAGSGRATASGSGTQETTTVAPGGSTSTIGGGTAGGTGSSGDAVKQTTTMSGWVMSEVKDDVGGTFGISGTGGFGSNSAMGRSTVPGIALLFTTYAIGLAWSPASRALTRFVVAAMTH